MPHEAIWVNADATQVVKSVPGGYKPLKGDLLLKTITVAVNPGDFKHPEKFGAVNTVEGFDAVGEVVDIGPETEGFGVGDKVLTFARGIGPAEWGAAQEFFLALAATCWHFDESKLSEEQAATIPLSLFTACDGLYNRMRPALSLPWEDAYSVPILLWGASSQVSIQAIQFAKFTGCHPIIATASLKQHDYLRTLGAHAVFDYKDKDVVRKIRGVIPASKKLRHAFNCVDASVEPFDDAVEQGGSIILALPPTKKYLNHHVEMAVAGTVHDLETFRAPEFKFHEGREPRDSYGSAISRSVMTWTLKEVGVRYQPPRVRTMSRRGMYYAFEAFSLMRENRISGEKVVWRMSETPR